jgi:putative membrane protein
MFGLIGAAIFLAVVFPGQFAGPTGTRFAGWSFGWIWGVLGILFFVWVLIWIVRAVSWGTMGPYFARGYHWHYGHDPAAAIARERYARGEITREQYDQMMRDLEQHPGPP